MWWGLALAAIMLVPLIGLKLFLTYQLWRISNAAPGDARSVLLASSAVCLTSVAINAIVLGSAVFVTLEPAPGKSQLWELFSLLIICAAGMSLAGWRQRRLRAQLSPEGEAFIQAVHVPNLPWKRPTDSPSETT
jgi:hypothetical protein